MIPLTPIHPSPHRLLSQLDLRQKVTEFDQKILGGRDRARGVGAGDGGLRLGRWGTVRDPQLQTAREPDSLQARGKKLTKILLF